MRLKQIREAGDEFLASCDGLMLKPVTPVSDQWYDATPNKTTNDWQLRDKNAQDDPWAKCVKATAPRRHGVLCDVYYYDADGKPDGEPIYRTIYRAQDIGGLWSDYLLLHVDEVTERAEERLSEVTRKQVSKDLNARLAKIGFKFPVGRVMRHRAHDQGPSDSTHESSTITIDTDNLSWLRRSHKLADGSWPWYTPRMVVAARNSEDVDYLLDVITEGVKALARKEARKEARKNGNGRSAQKAGKK